MAVFVGVDIGGTFTDLVGFDAQKNKLLFSKTLTTYPELVSGVVTCLEAAAIDTAGIDIFKHGTTLVINTLLERRGARTALITTSGFRDILEIGRAGRPIVFDLQYQRNPPLVPRHLRWEADERITAEGKVLRALSNDDLEALAQQAEQQGIEAVAISFLNAYKNPVHEQQAAEFLRRRLPGVYVSAATELSGDWFEYERTATAVANAYVGPQAATYVDKFDARLKEDGFPGTLFLMSSNGGVMSVARTKEQPLALVESGPVGGCIGATVYARELGIDRVIAFDMGGTTTKCALIQNHDYDIENTYYVGGYAYGFPVRTPVLDIVEVGTGGGSIVSVDANRHLSVGPRSAGSTPGPACFGKGGSEPTVTDANLVLNRIGSGAFLQGALQLNREAAIRAVIDKVGAPLGFGPDKVDAVAMGILSLATAQMMSAIKEITVERGKDTRDFQFFVFGGGGALHATSIARELHIGRVIVPPEPGNFSALGMLLANARMDVSQTFLTSLENASAASIWERVQEMALSVSRALRRDFGDVSVTLDQQLDMRYKGQRHSVRVPVAQSDSIAAIRASFLKTYLDRYGLDDPVCPIELIGIRVTGYAIGEHPDLRQLHSAPRSGSPAPVSFREVYFEEIAGRTRTPVYLRNDLPVGHRISGPAVIEEFSSTTLIGPRDRLEVGELGELYLYVG